MPRPAICYFERSKHSAISRFTNGRLGKKGRAGKYRYRSFSRSTFSGWEAVRISAYAVRLLENKQCNLIPLETDGKRFDSQSGHLNAPTVFRLYILSRVSFVGDTVSFDSRIIRWSVSLLLKEEFTGHFPLYCTKNSIFHYKFCSVKEFEQDVHTWSFVASRKKHLFDNFTTISLAVCCSSVYSATTLIIGTYIYTHTHTRIRTILLASRPGESGIESNRLSERKLAGWEIV